MEKTMPLAEAKKHLSSMIRDIELKYDRFLITKKGVGKAVVLSSEEFEGLVETLDILSSREEREAIARAKKEVRKGETVPLEAVKKRYGLR